MPVNQGGGSVNAADYEEQAVCLAVGPVGIRAGFGSVRCNDGVGAIAVLVDTGQTVALKVLSVIFQFAADFLLSQNRPCRLFPHRSNLSCSDIFRCRRNYN